MLYRGLSRWLSRSRAPYEVAALAFALSLPAIATGLVADDFDLAAQVAEDPLSAYRFSSTDGAERAQQVAATARSGARPWWQSVGFRQAFLRPLSSLSHALDFALWPSAVWWMHVQNSLLYAASVLLAFAIFHRLGLPPVPRGLATFFYAFNGNQSMTVGWISGRNTLLAACFGWLALWLHMRSAELRRPVERALAVACAGAALLSAEGGVGALAFVGAYSVVLGSGPLGRRLWPLWPYALLVLSWRLAYVIGGYGVVGSGFYRDPGHDPVGVLLGTLGAAPIYLASQLTVPFASMSGVGPDSFARVLALSLLLLALLYPLLRPLLRDDERARFLGLGAVLATLPLGTTLPQDRLVFFIGLGTSGLLAMLVSSRLSAEMPSHGRRAAGLLLSVHGVAMPLLFVPVLFSNMNQFLGGGAIALDGALPRRADVHVVLLNGPSHLPVHFQRRMRAHRGEAGIPVVDMLYAGGGRTLVRRIAAEALEVQVARGWLATPIESTMRDLDLEPFRAGDRFELPRMRVRVLEVDGRGAPLRVRFEFRPTPGLERQFFRWDGRQPQRIELPIGGQLQLEGIGPI